MLHLQFACSNFHSACSICSSRALISIPRALFAVRVLYFPLRVLHLQFACSNFHSACSICSSHALISIGNSLAIPPLLPCSICSSHALISIPRALFAVRTLYFHFRALHLQFACSTFSFACSICSSHGLFSFSRALFAVRVFYLQLACFLQFACCIFSSSSIFYAACSICSSHALVSFYVRQLQLARFNVLAFPFTARALDRAICALLYLHVTLCCGLWHMNKALRLKWLQHG